jgi:hypothetical protein
VLRTWTLEGATASHIRSSLSKLLAKIAELDYDIGEFNDYVKLQRSALLARGEQSTDLLVNIFGALGTVPDKAFVIYVDRIKDDYNMMDPRVNEDYLMAMSESKCRTMKQEGKYNIPSKANVKIIALSAEFERMQSLNTTLQAQLASQRENRAGRGDQGGCSGCGGRGGQGGCSPGHPNTREYAWKDVPPAAGAPLVKVVGAMTYHLCPRHVVWTVPMPAAWSLPEDTPIGPADGAALPNAAQTLAAIAAIAAIAGEQGNIFHDVE